MQLNKYLYYPPFVFYSFFSLLFFQRPSPIVSMNNNLQCSPSSAPRHNTLTFSTSQPSPKFFKNDIEKYPRCSGCLNELKAHEVEKTEFWSLSSNHHICQRCICFMTLLFGLGLWSCVIQANRQSLIFPP